MKREQSKATGASIMTDAAAGAPGGKGEKSPLLPPPGGGDGGAAPKAGGGAAAAAASGGGAHIERSVSWVLLSFLILGEIAGQGVFALPLHLGRLGWL